MMICSGRFAFSMFIGCSESLLLLWALGSTALVVGYLLILTAGLLSTHWLHVANSVVYWVVANTGWHRNGCGTSGPTARANSVAWGGLQYVYQ